MPSLSQLLADHAPLLLLDAASAKIQVGWLTGEASTSRWAESAEEAGTGLFRCLAGLGVPPQEAGAFLFCDGPGSVLGIRTAAMALRTWNVLKPRPSFRFQSTAVVAAFLQQPDTTVIVDARRDAWHAQRLGGPLRRVATAELSGELVTLAAFRHWTPLPAGTREVPYLLPQMLPALSEHDLFAPVAEPDAFLHEEPTYVTWSRQIHRAP